MQYSEKLDFLMNITGTSNSALARSVSLDASYISRLRSGKRMMPHNCEFAKSMATYFSRNCGEEFRQKAIADALGVSALPQSLSAVSELIGAWLLEDTRRTSDTVGLFLGGLSVDKSRSMPKIKPEKSEVEIPREELTVYYGVNGKRKAVLCFLSKVIACEKSQTLLLFSDEETSWMTTDSLFVLHWSALMMKTLALGHRIIIIHTVSRNLDEMLNAIAQWIPLYMAGTIESYFYPKKRDGLLKRTLFVAPGTAAVVSASVGERTEISANLLFQEPEAIAAYEDEFLQILGNCRPLMRVFNSRERAAFLTTLLEFENEAGNAILITESLSVLTMPDELFQAFLRRTDSPPPEFSELGRSRFALLERLMKTNTFTEIIFLPEPRDVLEGKVKSVFSELLEAQELFYKPEEYIYHLKNIVDVLEKCDNYHVHLVNGPAVGKYAVYVKEDLGVIVTKTSQPPVALAMSEGNMTAAFWDYLINIAPSSSFKNPDNAAASKLLRAYIKKLSDLC